MSCTEVVHGSCGLYYAAVLIGHVTGLAVSICPSVGLT